MTKLMTVEEAISSLSSSTQVRFVDKQGGDGYIAGNYNCRNTVSVKWLKKNHDSKYQKYSFGHIWDNYKVMSITADEYDVVTLHLNVGLTRKQEAAKDRKFRKEHDGMSEREVRHRTAANFFTKLTMLNALLMPWSEPYDVQQNNKDRRK